MNVKNIGLSDHLPKIAVRRYKGQGIQHKKQNNTLTYRDLKHLDEHKFIEELSEAPWDTAFVFEDTDDIVDSWYKIFNDVLGNHIPIKQKRVKRRAQPNWFTSDLIDDLRKRDKLLENESQEIRES